jgi:hypothetical protein
VASGTPSYSPQAYELQQENPSQRFLARVEKLVAEIFFEADIAL